MNVLDKSESPEKLASLLKDIKPSIWMTETKFNIYAIWIYDTETSQMTR